MIERDGKGGPGGVRDSAEIEIDAWPYRQTGLRFGGTNTRPICLTMTVSTYTSL
ncbi:hypothetical protein [Bradyrhizobium cenepequi]|uniref:hypothetical protein n=1 Tax=Bradyrhizobium cenepequi TaxID=2821403 RepID=UPI001CE2F0BC|nr:hypothetical protein [Bradyrhizobium cenepequi]MCA6107514.1 hypothetical protein [Bradyrhizobium cenepequi]